MSVLDLMALLTQLAGFMEPCHVKVDKLDRVIEEAPGALERARRA